MLFSEADIAALTDAQKQEIVFGGAFGQLPVASAPRDGTCKVPFPANGLRVRLSFRLRKAAAYRGSFSRAACTGGERAALSA